MTLLRTRLTEALAIDHPVVSAPMDEVAGGVLAAAVSGAGGLGLIGGGYGEAGWIEEQFALASGERIGCGFITWSLLQNPLPLELALQHEPVAIMLSFGDPEPFVRRIKDAGARVFCQVTSTSEALHAIRVGADVLIAQGQEAGGHGSGSRSTLTL